MKLTHWLNQTVIISRLTAVSGDKIAMTTVTALSRAFTAIRRGTDRPNRRRLWQNLSDLGGYQRDYSGWRQIER